MKWIIPVIPEDESKDFTPEEPLKILSVLN
jgi:hypothetical protein